MKKYIYFFIVALLASLVLTAIHNYRRALAYKALYSVAASNNKAYEQELIGNADKARVFQETLHNLKLSNDSISKKLLEVKKSRNIKDKELQAASYQKSTATKIDSIKIRDTILVNNTNIDTTINHNWYKLNLSLKYPSTIVVTPTFVSERIVLISTKKETINKPSKIFFVRWFQKKHIVINVDVEEKNPYINIEKQRFIKIIK